MCFKILNFVKLKFVKNKIKRIIKNKDKIKLHIGCGTNYFEGWINIDNNSDNNIQKLDINFDLRNQLPFIDNSVDFIYNEHFLEHLTVEEGLKTLKDFKRVLKPGGVLRIAMPDLESSVKEYYNPDWKSNPTIKKFGLEFIQTKAELINISFRWWGHKWLYDWEELERRLKEAGFTKIKRCTIKESDYEQLKGLETRDESTLIAEAVK
jgi:predicted SAM-dependent methyltransferase